MHDQQSIYTNSDWAEFFMLAATGQTEEAKKWKDSILKQEVRQQRQNQRQKAIKSTEIEWNPNDPQFW